MRSALAALLFCLLSGACASDAALKKRVTSLQEELDSVQSRADRLEERLTALEISRQKQTVHVGAEGDVSVDERPSLRVVKVAPPSAAAQVKGRAADQEAKPAEQGPRPVIRATGNGEGRIDNLEPEQTRSKPRSSPDADSDGGS